ncbi:MAG: hypothetical protein IT385_19005 [Deltaproteobacteria bacterium]|nr:hypothetical protein [Deltaproteobacteria bacterium]
MAAKIELVLFHDQDVTGVMQWSTTSNTGPWTDARLSAPLPLLDALAEWETTIGAAASRTLAFNWSWGGADFNVATSGGNLWLKLSSTLQDLTGLPEIVEDGTSTASVPTGLATFPIGRTYPREVEQSEISEYRGARVTAYHWGRAGEVTLDLLVPPDLWAALEGQSIVSGYGAIKVEWDNADPYSEDDLDGYFLVFPTDSSIEERESGEETVVAHVTGTLLDPGTTAAAGQDTAWAKLWRAVPYGYSVHYFLKVEGIPLLFCEYEGDAIAPTDYTLDASLVIDRSSRIGPVVTGSSNIGAAYDCDARLIDTPAVRALMVTPTTITRLRADCEAVDNALLVESAAGFEVGDIAYVGTSAEEITNRFFRNLGVARGTYGRLRSFKKGTQVASGPLRWENRRAELFAVLRDPCGRYVQGADVLSNAVMAGAFYVQERPTRAGLEWALPCRDQVRRLTQPLGVAASGRALWSVDDDGFVAVDANAQLSLDITVDGSTIENVTIRPFVGQSGSLRRSQVRAAIAAAFEAVATSSGRVSNFAWRRGVAMPVTPPDGAYDVFGLFASVTVTSSDSSILGRTSMYVGSVEFSRLLFAGVHRTDLPESNTTVDVYLGLRCITTAGNLSLSVVLDDGDPATLPASGWVALEDAGRTRYKRFTAATVDDSDPSQVNLTIDATTTPFTVDEVSAIVSDPAIANVPSDVSVKFFWRDSGRIYDILRRAIVSTGDAQHGTHDTLPRGQGLGLPDIDADSFVDVFDVFFRDLQFDVGSAAGTTLEELFGGVLRLSQRALTSRRAADGSSVDIAAVRVGSVDSLPVVRIDDAALVGGGPKPVRVLHVFTAPQAVEVKCRTLPVGDVPAGDSSIAITVSDVDSVATSWDLDIYGVTRSAILPAAKSWGVALARANDTRQVIEILLPAWYDVQGGDVVELDLVDPNLWDYAAGTSGEPGYSGMARVLGAPLILTDGIQAVTVMCDGVLGPGPMSPSLPIVAVNGSATAPTSIDVDDAYYDLLVAAKDGESTWKVLAYLPGQDSGRAEYTISTVTEPGGGVARLTVSSAAANPTVTLTTSYRLTWPTTSESTAEQARYLHADQRVQWGG